LILGRKGQGPLGVEWCNKDFWVIDTAYYASTLTPDIDLKYLYHLVKYVGLNHLKDGTSNPTLSRDTFGAQLFPLPPLSQQKAIASVLGALDDKIELNRRMNATLEAMARSLFQSWFVDFDPVRAKMDGRKPFGMDEATAALFPEHLEDSSLGHIPKGWEVKTVGDIGDVICGKTPPTSVSDHYGDDIPFITIPDMHGNVFCAATARKLSHAGAISQANKTLPPGSLCVSCIATPGLVVITSENSQTNQQINSVVPRQKEETYFWYWVMTGLGAEIASSGSGGSVLVNLSKGRFETLQVAKPPHALVRAYHHAVRPLFEAILANTHESRTLATLRDTLLPKLLSGEISIPAFK
jgi:type I restriction enzyme S subunit